MAVNIRKIFTVKQTDIRTDGHVFRQTHIDTNTNTLIFIQLILIHTHTHTYLYTPSIWEACNLQWNRGDTGMMTENLVSTFH